MSSAPLVVHVVHRFAVGGLENGVANLIDRLPEYRHAVIALTACDPAFCARIRRNDVVYRSLEKREGQDWGLYRRLARTFRELRPAVVHTRNLAALEAQLPAWWTGVPVRIHGEHGWDVGDLHGRRGRYRLLRRLHRPLVHRYVALSGHIQRYLHEGVGVPTDRIRRICNGVDTWRFLPPREDEERLGPFPPEALVLGWAGRMEAVKAPLDLVRAFAMLAGSGRPWSPRLRLLMVGEGSLMPQVRAELERAGLLERAWLPGRRDDLPDLYRAMDLFVLPSLAEGISNTILEAMASGLPVVATAVGGNPELLEPGVTGALVPPRDPAALAAALASYLDDPERLRREGRAARRRARERFSIEVMVEAYRDLYRELFLARGLEPPTPTSA